MTPAPTLARLRHPSRAPATSVAIGAAAGLAGLAIAAPAARTSAMALLALAATAALVAIVARPELAVTCVVGLMWADVPGIAVRDHGVPYVAAAALPLLLVVVIARDLVARRPPVLERGAGWVAAMTFAATLSTIVSGHQGRASATLASMALEGALLYLLVVNAVRSDRAARSAMWAMIAAGSWLALVAVAQGITQHVDQPFWGFAQLDLSFANGNSDVARAFGPVGDPNYFAQLLLPVVALTLVFARLQTSALLRRLSGAALLLTLAAIGYTGSRGAVVALAVMLVAALAIGVLRARHVLVALLVGGALLLTIPGYRDRVLSVVHPGSVTASAGDAGAADDAARSRATESLAALLAFQDHPVLGSGPGVFPLLYQHYAPRVGYHVLEKGRGSEAGQAPTREAHNLYLGIAADTGIVGLLAFLGFAGAILVPLLRGARRLHDARPVQAASAAALALALVGYLAAGLFLSLAYERYFWLLLGLGAATACLARSAEREVAAGLSLQQQPATTPEPGDVAGPR